MLSRDLGGIQTSFLTYSHLLRIINCDIINITSYKAKINSNIEGKKVTIPNYSPFDFLSILKIRSLINFKRPEVIIAHGNRAISFAYYAMFFLTKKPKIIGVAHNYSYRHIKKCDYVFCITRAMMEYMKHNGIEEQKLLYLPNSIDISRLDYKAKNRTTKTTSIGIMARLVPKKGVDIALKALRILKEQALDVRLVIAGEGSELEYLKQLTVDLGITSFVEFRGWVANSSYFYQTIDIFCLPSREEPFGIVILEAMMFGLPVVATNTDGPREIISDGEDGIIIDIDSSEQLANALKLLVISPQVAASLGAKSILKVKKSYSSEPVSLLLADYLKRISTNIHN